MTLTNHFRSIDKLTALVLPLVDSKEYEQAHFVIDDIETKCRLAHRHIDKLQLIDDFNSIPKKKE